MRRELKRLFPVISRGAAGTPATLAQTFDASQVSTGTLALARIPSVDITRLPADEVGKAQLVRRWVGKLDASANASVVDRTFGGDGAALVALGAAGSAKAVQKLDPTDSIFAVAGKTQKLYMRAFAYVGDVACNSGIGVVLLEVGPPAGGAAGADLSVPSVGTISGSTAANWLAAAMGANTRPGVAESSITPSDFTLAGVKYVVPRIQNFVVLNANVTVQIVVELYRKNN
jgi:hypothetical protein